MSVISNLSENEAHDALNQMVINFSLNKHMKFYWDRFDTIMYVNI